MKSLGGLSRSLTSAVQSQRHADSLTQLQSIESHNAGRSHKVHMQSYANDPYILLTINWFYNLVKEQGPIS